ncbi:MAG: group I truncated hemoglobin [Burkholderiales bacterium]
MENSLPFLLLFSPFIFVALRILTSGKLPPAPVQTRTLYEKIGGGAAVNAAVDIFYRKVLADDRISRFFEGVDMDRQAAKQKAFLSMAFGGPNNYSGEDMRRGHAHLVAKGLNDSHFDAVMENLGATLTELKVPGDLIAQAAAIAESTRKDVLGK